MDQVKQVRLQAIEAKKIFWRFLDGCNRLDFRAAFHLRPTSSGSTTIVSTLEIAPMRGLTYVSNNKLEVRLAELCKVLDEPSNKVRRKILEEIGFKGRKTESEREENVQAALIRDLILRPAIYGGMVFVASEFELFGYDENGGKTKRSDILAFKDGILYDIEVKKERLTETVAQAIGYVRHLHKNQTLYTDCLAEFPNNDIGKIIGFKGIALVPNAEKSSGRLENASESNDIELWYFNKDHSYQFIKHRQK